MAEQAGLPPIVVLGQGLREDFYALIDTYMAGWVANIDLPEDDWQELRRLEADMHRLMRIGDGYVALAQWLTAGFLPAEDALGPDATQPVLDDQKTTGTPGESIPLRRWVSQSGASGAAPLPGPPDSMPPAQPFSNRAPAVPSTSSRTDAAGTRAAEAADGVAGVVRTGPARARSTADEPSGSLARRSGDRQADLQPPGSVATTTHGQQWELELAGRAEAGSGEVQPSLESGEASTDWNQLAHGGASSRAAERVVLATEVIEPAGGGVKPAGPVTPRDRAASLPATLTPGAPAARGLADQARALADPAAQGWGLVELSDKTDSGASGLLPDIAERTALPQTLAPAVLEPPGASVEQTWTGARRAGAPLRQPSAPGTIERTGTERQTWPAPTPVLLVAGAEQAGLAAPLSSGAQAPATPTPGAPAARGLADLARALADPAAQGWGFTELSDETDSGASGLPPDIAERTAMPRPESLAASSPRHPQSTAAPQLVDPAPAASPGAQPGREANTTALLGPWIYRRRRPAATLEDPAEAASLPTSLPTGPGGSSRVDRIPSFTAAAQAPSDAPTAAPAPVGASPELADRAPAVRQLRYLRAASLPATPPGLAAAAGSALPKIATSATAAEPLDYGTGQATAHAYGAANPRRPDPAAGQAYAGALPDGAEPHEPIVMAEGAIDGRSLDRLFTLPAAKRAASIATEGPGLRADPDAEEYGEHMSLWPPYEDVPVGGWQTQPPRETAVSGPIAATDTFAATTTIAPADASPTQAAYPLPGAVELEVSARAAPREAGKGADVPELDLDLILEALALEVQREYKRFYGD